MAKEAGQRHYRSPLLSVVEVAGICGVSTKTVRRWIERGDLAVHRLGHQLRVAPDDLEERLPSKRLRNGLSRLMRYCSALGVRPDDVDDAVIGNFMVAVKDGTFVSNPDELHRRTTRIWNEAVETVQG